MIRISSLTACVFTIIPLLVVACGDDDTDDDTGSGGKSQAGAGGKGTSTGGVSPTSGGSTGGTSKGGSGGKASTGGSNTGGSNTGGAITGGSTSGGAITGGVAGADGGVAGAGGDVGTGGTSVGGGGAANDGGVGGWVGGSGGEPAGGVPGGGADAGGAGGAEAGAGGGPSITPDALENATFELLPGGTLPARGAIPGWTVTPGASGQEVASFIEWHAENGGATPGPAGYHLAYWLGSEYTVTVSQVVDPLPAGDYTFSMYVKGGANLFTSQYLFARGYSSTDTAAELKTDVTTTNTNGSTYSLLTVGPIPVTSGQVEVGVFSHGTANAWASLDTATLTKN